MLLDARSIPTDTTLSARICVVGAGPAGITLAHELAAAGVDDVLVVESGGWEDLPAADELNEAEVRGLPYAGLRVTRRRGVGGTARSWNTFVAGTRGAKYVPLDATDLTSEFAQTARWPLEWQELLPGYRRAQELCALGAFAYEAGDWPDLGAPLALEGTALTSRVYQFGPAQPWLETLPRSLARHATLRICTGATICGWRVDSNAQVCEATAMATGTERRFRVHAAHYVLACGAVENARQLLVLRQREPRLAIDPGDWLGRCFMEHPRADGVLERCGGGPATDLAFYDMRVLPGAAVVGGRVALNCEHGATRGLPALSLTLLPRFRPPTAAGKLLRRLGLAKPQGGYGWSALPTASRCALDFALRLNFEQRPLRSNRVLLAADLDPTGLPQVRLEWAWSEPEQRAFSAARSLIAETLARQGAGIVRFTACELPDFGAHHHAGTTRMAQEPREGVVDRDACVFGLDNLHVAGASVFPSAGYANPTLTIVALAVRLARRLAERIATGTGAARGRSQQPLTARS